MFFWIYDYSSSLIGALFAALFVGVTWFGIFAFRGIIRSWIHRDGRANHMVGFAQVTLAARHALAPAGTQAELLRLYVQEPFTGAKVGTQLLVRAEALAASAGASVLWLTPWVHNHRALAFYSGRGYADYGLTYFNLQGESHENRVLAKAVGVA